MPAAIDYTPRPSGAPLMKTSNRRYFAARIMSTTLGSRSLGMGTL